VKIYYNNKIESTTLVASSNGGSYSINDLKIPQLARSYGFLSNDEWVTIDMGAATNIKSFIVDMGNMSSTATITLEGNATDVWTSPSYSSALTVTDTAAYSNLDETYRWWRLTLDDSTITAIEIGYLFLDDGFLQMPGINPGVTLNYITTSKASFTIDNQVYGDEGFKRLDTSFTFPQIGESAEVVQGKTVASRQQILDMWENVENITPVWAFLWSDNLDEFPPVFCVLDQVKTSFKKSKYGKYYSCSLKLRQVN
jgi:hypothetical protein